MITKWKCQFKSNLKSINIKKLKIRLSLWKTLNRSKDIKKITQR